MATRKTIAIVGAGNWGKNLVRTFSQLGVLKIVCDANAEILKKTKSTYPDCQYTAHFEDLIQDPAIEGIVVATPAVTHHRLVKQALLAGKNVFVEKPLALNVREGEELVKLAAAQKKILMVGHILQYHNAVLKLKELIDRGDLGKIQYIYSNRLNIGTIRTEENILWSFAPHDISVMLMLLKEVPQAVHSTGGIYLQHNIMDVTMTNFTFSDGVRAHIFVSWLHPYKEQKLVVVGDRKMAVFDDVSKDKLFLYPHRVDWIDRVPVVAKAEAEVIPFVVEEPLRKECEHFLECIKEKRTPRTDGEEGLRVLQVLQMSQESLNSGEIIYANKKEGKSSSTYFLHESSYVDEDVVIGEGTQIWHYSHILKKSQIGKNCKIGQNVVIGPEVQLGNNCKIQNNVSVYKGVTLEDDVFCGPSMVFTNIINPRSAVPRMQEECKTTLIKKGATLGANATILCGITIGRYAFIGAGAVVTKSVADHALVYGNPAVFKGWMCVCGVKLEFKKTNEAACKECGKHYSLKDNCVAETTKTKK